MVSKQVNYYIELPMTCSYKDFDYLISEESLEQVVSDKIDGERVLGNWENWDVSFEDGSTYYGGIKIASIEIISSNTSEDFEETLEVLEHELKKELREIARFAYYLKLAEENKLNLAEEQL